MATSVIPKLYFRRSRFKTVLWISLGLTALFVFITSEVLLILDYPMYHAYLLQVIADRYLLIPHHSAASPLSLSAPSNSLRDFVSDISNSIASSDESTSSPFSLEPRLESRSPPAVQDSPEPPCRLPRGSSAPPLRSSRHAIVKSSNIGNG